MRPTYQYLVITAVPEQPDAGNLAWDLVLVDDGRGVRPYPFPNILDIRVPVFVLGEIVVCLGGREISGRQRKPSKWRVTYDVFLDVHQAIARATMVMAEAEEAAT